MIRRFGIILLAIAFAAGISPALSAQRGAPRTPIDSIHATPGYDVVLEVPRLSVDSIVLRVDTLAARLSAAARVANFVSLDAGVSVEIDSVGVTVAGVGAEVYLYVDLDNVARIVNRVVQTLDRNPAIVTSLLGVVDTTVRTVGSVANTAVRPGGVVSQTLGAAGQTLDNLTRPGGVLTQTVNTLGQTVQLTLDQTGNLVTRTLDTAGQVVNEQRLGALTSLPVLRQTAGTAGQLLKQARLPSGQIVEYAIDRAGRLLGARVVSPR